MFGRMLIGLQFCLILSSLYMTGLKSAYFKPFGKEELDRELLKLWYMSRTKISLFSLIIEAGVPEVWDAFFGLGLFYLRSIQIKRKLRQNFKLFILEILSLIQIILGLSLHFSMKALTLSPHKLEVWSSNHGS